MRQDSQLTTALHKHRVIWKDFISALIEPLQQPIRKSLKSKEREKEFKNFGKQMEAIAVNQI